MKFFKYSTYLLTAVYLFSSQSSYSQSTTELAELKKQINLLQKKIEQIEKEQKSKILSASFLPSNTAPSITKKNDLKFYATLRPTFGYIDENNESLWDVRDALSHAGFKATTKFDENWSAILHGEWGIDLSNNGDFGKARQVYVALNSPIGTIGIGKQRPAQYLFIAEYVDIFNHSNSPFSYDPESIFFVDNLFTYRLKTGDFTWMLASQFNGSDGDNNNDLTNIGLSYDHKGMHAALTYLKQDNRENGKKVGEDNVVAGSLAYEFNNSLYLALGYQNRDYQYYEELSDRNGHTFDLSASYLLSKRFKLKVGVFDFSDGYKNTISQNYNGYNTTLEWLPKPSLRFHIEYLHREFDHLDDFSSISVGFRYDLSISRKY